MHYFGYGNDDIELLEKVKSAYPKIETVGENAYGVKVKLEHNYGIVRNFTMHVDFPI